jgi:YYY domain-containing protein
VHRLALLLLVAFGLLLRLQKVNWDHGHSAHPDERHIMMVAATLEWPQAPADLLDPRRSTLNPFFRPDGSGHRQPERFAYGHMPLYLVRGLAAALKALSGPAAALLGEGRPAVQELARMDDHLHMTLLGRVLSALFDAGAIAVAYALGRRLYGRPAGVLAAALFTFTVMHIQLAHFYAVDTLLAFFVLLALYFLVRLLQGGGAGSAIGAGLGVALALGCKSSAAPLLLPWAATFLLLRRPTSQRLRLAAASAIAGLLVFALVSPYVILDFGLFLESVGVESKMVRGIYDFPYTRQYRRTPAYIYQILQQLRFGMGWLPGLLGFGGLAWGAWRLLRSRARDEESVLLSWALPYFLITGSFMVKFMRYMAPLTGVLLILGAGALSSAAARWPRLRRLFWGLGALALVYSICWSLAFSSIYHRPFTRHEASLWIYANIPPGSTITQEEWDDLIPYPLVLNGAYRSPGEYRVLSFPLQEPDDAAKVEMLVDRLTRADYIIVSSNRFYGWLPRLRDRFPVSNRYYELLFSGQLGFALEKEFTSRPRLGPLEIVDDRADESFTVYDHPRVFVFKKVRAIPPEDLRELFYDALASQEKVQELLLPVPVEEYPVVQDWGWNRFAQDGLPAAAWWWLVLTAIGLACWPLLQALAPTAWGAGWAFARPLGLALIAYPVWLLSSAGLHANRGSSLGGALVALGALGALTAAWRWRALAATLRARSGELILSESVSLGAYVLWVLVRLLNPDLWQPWWGGERPMEFGFLLAIARSARMPPYDPFYAGGYINYYYYGLYLVSCLVKLTGVRPEVAFNLALASLFSFVAAGALALGASLAVRRKLVGGLLSATLVCLLGNVDGGLQLVRGWGELAPASWWAELPLIGWLPRFLAGLLAAIAHGAAPPAYDFWAPSRVIPDTINEFPFFSFLYGDLHPHILNLPFVLAFLALALECGRGQRDRLWPAVRLVFLAILVGMAIAGNTWDAPLLLAALGVTGLFRSGRWSWAGLLRSVGQVVAVGALGALLFAPFLSWYRQPASGFALNKAGSPFVHFLRFWGLQAYLSLGLSWWVLKRGRGQAGVPRLLAALARHWERLPRFLALAGARPGLRRPLREAGWALGAGVLGAALLVAAGRAAGALCLSLGLLAFAAASASRSEGERVALSLTGLAWLILLGTELFFLRDWLAEGPAYRMNTVFKFGFQAWALLGLGCGSLLAAWWADRPARDYWWRSIAAILFLLAVVYPVLGSASRLEQRFPNARPALGTLDGMAFMTVGEYSWPEPESRIALAGEREALLWLRANVPGNPVVLEAALGYYREGGSRVAAYTGLPIPLGPQHEAEQRPKAPLGRRAALVRRFYETQDAQEALAALAELKVSYVYVGQLERIAYGEQGLAKLLLLEEAGVLARVFDNGVVQVYRVAWG